MNAKLLATIEKPYVTQNAKFEVGDTISIRTIVREGSKKRVQIFKGIVINKRGTGTRETFTVRKISYGIGVEKIFPTHSPNIESIELVKKGKVRKSKLFYMRNRIGKLAMKVAEGVYEEQEAEEAPEVEVEADEKSETEQQNETETTSEPAEETSTAKSEATSDK